MLQSISALSQLIQKKELSPVDLIEETLALIERLNPKLNAYLSVYADEALDAARRAESEIARGGYRGPLHGIPVSIKDIFAARGQRTTAGSKILADYVPDYDAAVIEKLKRAGAIIIGRTNLHEFALGTTTVNPHYGATRNPHDPGRIAGGSSGGSAVSVATGMAAASLGTDTGGSIRIPAALCGVVGLKPTFGRVSKFGVIPLAWSLDHVGPITRTARDAAILLETIAGYDRRDISSRDVPVPRYSELLGREVRGARIGRPVDYFFDILTDEARRSFEQATAALAELGCELVEVQLPSAHLIESAYLHTSLAEAAAYHQANLRRRPADYGDDVRARLELGTSISPSAYLDGQRARRALLREFEAALELADALVTPTVPLPATLIGEEKVEIQGRSYNLRSLHLRLTCPFNLTGLPAISIPCGSTRQGLPLGIQIAGRRFDEERVLVLAHALESQIARR